MTQRRNPATTLRFARGDRDLVVVYSDGSVACHDTATFQPRFRVAGALPSDEGTTTLDLSGDLLTVGFGTAWRRCGRWTPRPVSRRSAPGPARSPVSRPTRSPD
ncbi:hypothetical protein V2I01_38600 [Micromonospora sp. BRA006-A]|nr:hypothetical protein [Micromonospora sp. BRA006-A]